MIRVRLLCAAVLSASALFSSAASAQAPSASVIKATAPIPLVRFEVVSIRRSHSQYSRGPGFTDDGFSVDNNGLFSLFSVFLPQRIVGMPESMRTMGWDIRAKVADSDVESWKKLSFQQRALSVQAMMEDRFHLKSHVETRVTSGYALVVGKGGLKIKEAVPGDTYPNGFKNLGGGPLLGVLYQTGPDALSAQAITMSRLADSLQGFAGKPVIDKTGLSGKYDFKLKHDAPRSPALTSTDPAAASEPAGASIFTEIQEQLGLKLEPGAMVLQDFLVIDHVEPPTEN